MLEDGIYLVACRGDNHILYEIHEYHQGQRFWEFFEGENVHSDGWFTVEPMGYYRLPKLKDRRVDKIPQNPDSLYIVAIFDNENVVIEYNYAYGWNESDSDEILARGLKYKLIPHERFGEWRLHEWLRMNSNNKNK